jgi:hypothetical protein
VTVEATVFRTPHVEHSEFDRGRQCLSPVEEAGWRRFFDVDGVLGRGPMRRPSIARRRVAFQPGMAFGRPMKGIALGLVVQFRWHATSLAPAAISRRTDAKLAIMTLDGFERGGAQPMKGIILDR